MSETQDRPASDALRRDRRRPPSPAPDESTDPVDYHPSPAAPPQQPAAAAPVHLEALSRRRGRDRGLPFSTRLEPDVIDTLENAVASGQQPTLRAALEHAIRTAYAPTRGA